MDSETEQTFTEIRDRLEEIAVQVKAEDISLDAALDLYEEAVKLGTKASDLLESMNDAPTTQAHDSEEHKTSQTS